MGNKAWADAKVKDVYRNPIGRDIISKILLQMNLPEILAANPIVGNLSLKTIGKLSGGRLSDSFRQSLASLLESAEMAFGEGEYGGMDVVQDIALNNGDDEKWWKKAVFYQIYPRAFADSNGDGIGDLRGIAEKLDYLKTLGIDAIWLSPIYDSPGDDNGYDIRDYAKIDPMYGDMPDFDDLLAATHARGMRLIMDLVVNHTSDEHSWFKAALADGKSHYRDYYITRAGGPGAPPNNWTSFFSGPAWNYYPDRKMWAMHLFSKKQIDLNWENPSMRDDIYAMIRAWLNKGVDGFRLDVVNYISKAKGLPDGDVLIGDMMGYRGIEHYFFGPELLRHLREMKKKAFEPFDAFTVGETPGIGLNMTKLLTDPIKGGLDLIFCFDHLENPGKARFDEYVYDLNFLKGYLIRQARQLANPALYFENHDNPRMPSKVDPTGRFHDEISRLLAFIMLTLPGTPFIYQGQELGEANIAFKDIGEIGDVESLGLYADLISKGASVNDAFRKILAGTRDHARRPMDWSKIENNAVLECFKDLIELRRNRHELTGGDIEFYDIKRRDFFAFTRCKAGSRLLMVCNLGQKAIKAPYMPKLPQIPPAPSRNNVSPNCVFLYSTRGGDADVLRPYECRIYET